MKKFVIVTALICIAVIALGFFAIFGGVGREIPETPEERDAFEIQETEEDEEGEEEDDILSEEDEQGLVGFEATPEEVPEQSCREQVAEDVTARNTDYYEGRVIVSFPQSTPRDDAIKAVEVFGYRPDSEQVKQYNANYFFTAYVTRGEEIDAVCNLRGRVEVRNAVLDYKLDLVL